MFRDVLETMVKRANGCVGALIMGTDGIPVDKYLSEIAGPDTPDIEATCLEYGVIVPQVRKAAQMLDAGEAEELSIKTEKGTILIRSLSDQYFVALALQSKASLGRARFVLRCHISDLKQALE